MLLPSPNNPTGTALPPEAVSVLCEAVGDDGLLVVDEAYGEFRRVGHAERPRAAAAAPQPRGHPHDEQGLRPRRRAARLPGRRPGDLRRPADRPAALPPLRDDPGDRVVALSYVDELLGHVDDLRVERDATVAWLREQGHDVADSDANFVLFGRFADRHAVWQGLVDRGVLIRETGPDGWLRVSVGTADEMAAFRAALIDTMETQTMKEPA